MLKRFEKNNGQKGLTLIELMVGIAVSLVLLAGVVTVLLRITVAGGESIQATRLNQQLRGAVDLMSKELQRAGYVNWAAANTWATDADGNFVDANGDGSIDILDFYEEAIPSINEFGNVQLFVFPTPGNAASGAATACNTGCDCVLYSYDIDGDGGMNTGSFELFGFRWNNGQIEMRTGGSPASCDAGAWQLITDDYVNISNVTFEVVYADAIGAGNDSTVYPIIGGNWGMGTLATNCTPVAGEIEDDKCLWRRKVAITVSGQLADDSGVSAQIVTDVKIKNDHFNTAP